MPEFVDRTYKTADGTELPMRVWRPESPRAAVVYLHGIQSHNGWYEPSSRHLASQGLAVYQVERRGSGRDAAHERGHVERAEVWLDDVAAAAEQVRRETGLPAVHLLAVSWGGKLALACAAHRPDLYRSLVLAAPGLVPRVDVTVITKVRIARALMARQPLRRFRIPLDDPALFTANPERQRYIASDPLSLREVTARFLAESRRLDRLARRATAVARAPTFLVLAEHDRIIDNAATRQQVLSMSVRRRIVVHPGAHHTLEFEADPTPYFRDLAAWIDEAERGV